MSKPRIVRHPKPPNLYKKVCIINEDNNLIFMDTLKSNYFMRYSLQNSEIKIIEDSETNRKESIGKKLMDSSRRVEFDIFFGFVHLIKSKYAVFVKRSEFAGFLMKKQSIWRACEFEICRIGAGSGLNSEQSDESYLYLLQKLFKTRSFYFSHYYDLTNNLQTFISQSTLKPNSRFFANEGRFNPSFPEGDHFKLRGSLRESELLVANALDHGAGQRNAAVRYCHQL